ncbi:hypothetical protein [Lacticaseibacillus sp. GG6-2]
MLMMQYSSGLSRFEVRKAQLINQPTTQVAEIRIANRPTLLLATGLVAVAAGFGGMVPAVLLAMALLLLVSSFKVLVHRWLQVMDNGSQPVMVIREGLMRQCTVADLVVGDRLYLGAGAIVPVDVQSTVGCQANGLTAFLVRLFGIQLPAELVMAGSRLTADAQVQVAAIGNDRLVLKQLLPILNSDLAMTVHIGARLVELLNGAIAGVGQHVASVTADRKFVASTQDLIQADQATQMTLVDNNRQAAKETAFRYNQDPVSWAGR